MAEESLALASKASFTIMVSVETWLICWFSNQCQDKSPFLTTRRVGMVCKSCGHQEVSKIHRQQSNLNRLQKLRDTCSESFVTELKL